jgi:hypothetical protein
MSNEKNYKQLVRNLRQGKYSRILPNPGKTTSVTVKHYDRSFNPSFTERFFKPPCPHCSGIEFSQIEAQGNLKNNLCPKCRAKLNIRIAGVNIYERGTCTRASKEAA